MPEGWLARGGKDMCFRPGSLIETQQERWESPDGRVMCESPVRSGLKGGLDEGGCRWVAPNPPKGGLAVGEGKASSSGPLPSTAHHGLLANVQRATASCPIFTASSTTASTR